MSGRVETPGMAPVLHNAFIASIGGGDTIRTFKAGGGGLEGEPPAPLTFVVIIRHKMAIIYTYVLTEGQDCKMPHTPGHIQRPKNSFLQKKKNGCEVFRSLETSEGLWSGRGPGTDSGSDDGRSGSWQNLLLPQLLPPLNLPSKPVTLLPTTFLFSFLSPFLFSNPGNRWRRRSSRGK